MKQLSVLLIIAALVISACAAPTTTAPPAAAPEQQAPADEQVAAPTEQEEAAPSEGQEAAPAEESGPKSGGTLRVAFQNEWAGLDNHTVSSYSSYQILNNVTEGLTFYDDDLN
ncbi:MAG: hypothetical protein ACK2U9_11920, partial [Anaerolineae bacterium]